MVRRRLDTELVRRGLARSRQQAADLVAGGQVLVGGVVAHKVATQVDAAASLSVRDAEVGEPYASRGATKLLGALQSLVSGVYKGPFASLQTFFAVSHDSATGRFRLEDGSVQRGPLWWAAHHRHHHGHSGNPNMQTGISVSGSGEAKAKPDIAKANLGVEVRAATVVPKLSTKTGLIYAYERATAALSPAEVRAFKARRAAWQGAARVHACGEVSLL